jgi:enoyl-CoA hydratase/carnithine racemase
LQQLTDMRGGGFELALACHLRFAQKTQNLDFPRINLGVIPDTEELND